MPPSLVQSRCAISQSLRTQHSKFLKSFPHLDSHFAFLLVTNLILHWVQPGGGQKYTYVSHKWYVMVGKWSLKAKLSHHTALVFLSEIPLYLLCAVVSEWCTLHTRHPEGASPTSSAQSHRHPWSQRDETWHWAGSWNSLYGGVFQLTYLLGWKEAIVSKRGAFCKRGSKAPLLLVASFPFVSWGCGKAQPVWMLNSIRSSGKSSSQKTKFAW